MTTMMIMMTSRCCHCAERLGWKTKDRADADAAVEPQLVGLMFEFELEVDQQDYARRRETDYERQQARCDHWHCYCCCYYCGRWDEMTMRQIDLCLWTVVMRATKTCSVQELTQDDCYQIDFDQR